MRVTLGICSIVLLSLASSLAAPNYSRTRDRKTRVWNNSPAPNETVTWSGGTDADGYATGPGTVTWYVSGKLFTTGSEIPRYKDFKKSDTYTGNMVRGKFEGLVTQVTADGKTFHGDYVNGRQAPGWSAGPSPAGKTRREKTTTSPQSTDRPITKSKEEAPGPTAPTSEKKLAAPTPERKPIATPAPQLASTPSASPAPNDSLNSLTKPPSSLRLNRTESPSPTPSP